MAVTKSCLGIALAISIFLLRAESQLITKPQGAPDDVWTVEEREAFLQQAGFRFPMTHGVLKQVEGEDGAPAKVVARADTKSAEYAKWQRLADIRRARGRRLKVGDVIDYTVGGGIASALRNAYYITISLGSKQQKFNVQVDTGSDLLWVPCDCIQCANDTAYSGAPFSPVASGTTEFESCESRVCASLAAQAPQFGCNVERRGVVNASDPNCEYWYAYADNSSTFGNLVTDSFNFQLSTGESLSPRLLFGCSSIQDGNLVDERNALDGLIGLGGGDLSVFQQLEEQGVIANTFALCLEGQGVGGHLFLGTSSLPSNAQYIELLGQDGETFYRVDLVGLQVAGQDLPLDASIFETDEEGSFRGSILDSGTTFTLLPTDAWTALAAAVGDAVGVQFFEVGGYSCLGLRRPLTFEDLDALFPMVAMVFGNGTAWDLPPSSYLFFNGNRVCIAALDAGVLPLTIIASSWMRNFFVLHDRSNNRIGFVPFNCTSLQPLSAVDGPAAPPTENPVAGADDSTAGPPPPALPAPSPASSARPPPPPPALTLTPTPSPTSSPTRNVPPPPNKAPPANEASPSSTNAPPLALPPPAASSPAPRSPPSSAGTAINSTSAPSAPKSGSCHLASLVLAALACIASGAFAL